MDIRRVYSDSPESVQSEHDSEPGHVRRAGRREEKGRPRGLAGKGWTKRKKAG